LTGGSRQKDGLGKTMAIYSFLVKRAIKSRIYRMRLKNRDFTIISNNCIGGGIYQTLNIPYKTPTVGLFIYSEDYIKLLENLDRYLAMDLKFIKKSRFPQASEIKKQYPIGTLNDEIEIHFLHYKNKKEAMVKWNRSKKRINKDNLFFIYSDRDGFREEFLTRYDHLPYKNKVFFTSKPYDHPFVVHVKDYDGEETVGDSDRNKLYEKYLDIVEWLNNGK